MLYKYSAILDIDPIVDIQDNIKSLLDTAISEYNIKYSSLDELSIKEQLKFYMDKHLQYSNDRDRMLELIDKL